MGQTGLSTIGRKIIRRFSRILALNHRKCVTVIWQDKVHPFTKSISLRCVGMRNNPFLIWFHCKSRKGLLLFANKRIEFKCTFKYGGSYECTKDWKCNILSVNTDIDHIHILFEAPPQVQLSSIINNYKTVTSRLIRKKFTEQLKPYYWKNYFWSNSYFVCTVSERSEQVVKQYIERQWKA